MRGGSVCVLSRLAQKVIVFVKHLPCNGFIFLYANDVVSLVVAVHEEHDGLIVCDAVDRMHRLQDAVEPRLPVDLVRDDGDLFKVTLTFPLSKPVE